MADLKPCERCGEHPKIPGRGQHLCSVCRGTLTCGHEGGWVDKKNSRLRCNKCVAEFKKRTGYRVDASWRYGITVEEVDELRSRDCAVCGATRSSDGRKLHIDHCHRTGKVRGVLCNKCNVALGLLDDSPERIAALGRYLEASA